MTSRIAIVGSGISGLGAAWALQRDHDVVVFEADDRLGGHSNTVLVDTPQGSIPVDTGFIVYNEVTYPHLTRLFDALSVPTQPSDMSFSFSLDGDLEYGASLGGLLAQPSNLLRRRYRMMISDILRFRRIGHSLIAEAGDEPIDELLLAKGFSEGFIDDYLLPMTGAIWSARRREVRRFPASSMLRFLANHGLIRIAGRPEWRTVTGGSVEYVERLAAPFRDRIRLGTPVTSVVRDPGGVTVVTPVGSESFDEVILATHSDQALSILGDGASPEERQSLEAIRYEPNVAYLHADRRLMPTRPRIWSSWNAMASPGDRDSRLVSVTYWMNRLQSIDQSTQLFVSLNPLQQPDPELIYGTFHYAHPQFDASAVIAQSRLAEIQGSNRTWFAGAYCGYGFHEDGLQAGFNVAAALGSPPPWHDDVTPMSSSPAPLQPASGPA